MFGKLCSHFLSIFSLSNVQSPESAEVSFPIYWSSTSFKTVIFLNSISSLLCYATKEHWRCLLWWSAQHPWWKEAKLRPSHDATMKTLKGLNEQATNDFLETWTRLFFSASQMFLLKRFKSHKFENLTFLNSRYSSHQFYSAPKKWGSCKIDKQLGRLCEAAKTLSCLASSVTRLVHADAELLNDCYLSKQQFAHLQKWFMKQPGFLLTCTYMLPLSGFHALSAVAAVRFPILMSVMRITLWDRKQNNANAPRSRIMLRDIA